jgi:hypothetical protein
MWFIKAHNIVAAAVERLVLLCCAAAWYAYRHPIDGPTYDTDIAHLVWVSNGAAFDAVCNDSVLLE